MTRSVSGPGSPITVGSLPAGDYEFTVTATNSAGTGGHSVSSAPTSVAGDSAPPAASVTVDFRTTGHPLDKWSVGSTISTFSGSGLANINRSPAWRASLGALGPLSWRIPLRYAKGHPGSSASGAQTSGDAVTYIENIRSIGGTPYPGIGGDSRNNGESTDDVAAFVRYFDDGGGARAGGRLERLAIGNEPDTGTGGPPYLEALDGLVAAAKRADSAILCEAPSAAYWDADFLASAAGHVGVDILAYHAYDGADTDGGGFPTTIQYHQHILDLRAMRGGLRYGVEEVNWHSAGDVAGFFDWRNTCFIASVIGQVITAGGHVNHYADSNGALGLLNDGNGQGQPGAFGDPLPAYWGIGMWTGMNGTFRRFGGATVPATSTVTDVDVFATDNAKIVLVNKDTAAHAVTVGLGGRDSGVYDVWQTARASPTAAPRRVVHGAGYSRSLVSLTLPAGTVSSLELDAG